MGLNKIDYPKDYNQAQELLGYISQSPASAKNYPQNNENQINIKEFHEKVLKFLIEMFYRENFKFISFLPGGFEECH